MADEITDAITEAITNPLMAKSDAGEVQMNKLTDMVAAAQYLATVNAARKRGRGIRFSKLIPPGNVSDNDPFQSLT